MLLPEVLTDFTYTPDGIGASTDKNFIGRSQYNDTGLKGYVDDFRFYTRALSAEDIKKIMQKEGQAFSLQYPFSGSSAETTYYPVTAKFQMDLRSKTVQKMLW
jgi:hypothetical protein